MVHFGVINEAVTLNFQVSQLVLNIRTDDTLYANYIQNAQCNVGIILKIKTLGNDATYQVAQTFLGPGTFTTSIASYSNGQNVTIPDFNVNLPPGILQENSEISVEYRLDNFILVNLKAKVVGGSYQITQTPIPTLPILTGNNAIWGYFNKATNPSNNKVI